MASCDSLKTEVCQAIDDARDRIVGIVFRYRPGSEES